MTNMPFKRTRIHEGAGGILMSRSTAGHYQWIYPQELSLLDNSITVAQAHREFKNKKQEHDQIRHSWFINDIFGIFSSSYKVNPFISQVLYKCFFLRFKANKFFPHSHWRLSLFWYVDRNQRRDKQCGDRFTVAILVFGQKTALTRHHHCSGDLIRRAVFLAAGSRACTRDCCISGVLHQKKYTAHGAQTKPQPMWCIIPWREKNPYLLILSPFGLFKSCLFALCCSLDAFEGIVVVNLVIKKLLLNKMNSITHYRWKSCQLWSAYTVCVLSFKGILPTLWAYSLSVSQYLPYK